MDFFNVKSEDFKTRKYYTSFLHNIFSTFKFNHQSSYKYFFLMNQ